MKPPICHLCKRLLSSVASRTKASGDLVRFADYLPLPDRMVGHPHGLEWFCADHVAAAEAASSKNINEAMDELHRIFGNPPKERTGVFRQLMRAFRKQA